VDSVDAYAGCLVVRYSLTNLLVYSLIKAYDSLQKAFDEYDKINRKAL
jgi:hypothetical protein